MSKYQSSPDVKFSRTVRSWSLESLRGELKRCQAQEVAPGMHKEGRQFFKQRQQALIEEIERRGEAASEP